MRFAHVPSAMRVCSQIRHEFSDTGCVNPLAHVKQIGALPVSLYAHCGHAAKPAGGRSSLLRSITGVRLLGEFHHKLMTLLGLLLDLLGRHQPPENVLDRRDLHGTASEIASRPVLACDEGSHE